MTARSTGATGRMTRSADSATGSLMTSLATKADLTQRKSSTEKASMSISRIITTKATGKTARRKAVVATFTQRQASMTVCGPMIRRMEMVPCTTMTTVGISACGKMEKSMGRVHSLTKMAPHSLDSSRTTRSKMVCSPMHKAMRGNAAQTDTEIFVNI